MRTLTTTAIATVLRHLLAVHARVPDALMAVRAQRHLLAPPGESIRADQVMAARQLLADLEAAPPELPALDRARAQLCMDACRGIPSEWLMGRRFRVTLTGQSFDLAKVHP